MENNETDFMKNRPLASTANQYKDVYGTKSQNGINTLTVVLSLLMCLFAVLSYVNGKNTLGTIFLVVFAALIISAFVSFSCRKHDAPVLPPENNSKNNTVSFKEHEE